MKIQNYIDQIIKKSWLTGIKSDYDNHTLLYEDSVKCALYHHFRKYVDKEWLQQNDIRIYPEFYLPHCGERADIAIVKLKDAANRKVTDLSECVESILAIIEINYKNTSSTHEFFQDINKLSLFAKEYQDAQLYAAFIHEEYDGKHHVSGLDGQQTSKWAKGTVSELLGYWDKCRDEFVTEVRSYDPLPDHDLL